MDQTGKPSDLFVKLSPRVAEALAMHLVTLGATHSGLPGRAALRAALASLPDAAQLALAPTLARLTDLCGRHARACVLTHARESQRDSMPWSARLLDAISTPDLAVRLYLDDESAFERAHFQYATALLEQVAIYQGQYIADVIPSVDRRARMLKALQSLHAHRSAAHVSQVADFVSDDRVVLALHHGADVGVRRRFDAARQLDPNLCQPEIDTGVLFRFDSSLLIVKAASLSDREALRDAFCQIFVGDPHYFEAQRESRPRYRLVIEPARTEPVARPSLVKASARAKPSITPRTPRLAERAGSLTAPNAQIHQELLLRIRPPFAPRLS